jgi:hypothetical protein
MLDPELAARVNNEDDDPLRLSSVPPAASPAQTARPAVPAAVAPVVGGPMSLPSARRYEGGSFRPEPAPPVRMNKWIYRLTIFGGLLATAAIVAQAARDPRFASLAIFLVWIPVVPTILMSCAFIYKMWAAIDDRRARTTPGKAVGFLFIPLFNLYWLFEALPGYASDYNAYLERHRIGAARLDRNLFLATMLLPGVGLFFGWQLIGRVCDGVNALSS